MKIFLYSLCFFLTLVLSLPAFAELKQQFLRKNPDNYLNVEIEYDPQIVKTVGSVFSDFVSEGKGRLILKSPLKKGGSVYDFFYHDGASDDPTIVVYSGEKENRKILKEIHAYRLRVLGDGYFYTSGHTNNYFDQTRKWQIVNGQVQEVVPEFYHVGLKNKVLKDLKLYKTRKLQTVVAELKMGEEAEVLLSDGNGVDTPLHFLVKTKEGVLGWFQVNDLQLTTRTFSGIVFAGD